MKNRKFSLIGAATGMAILLTLASFVRPQDADAGCFRCQRVWSDTYGDMHDDYWKMLDNNLEGTMHSMALGQCDGASGHSPYAGGGGGGDECGADPGSSCDPQ